MFLKNGIKIDDFPHFKILQSCENFSELKTPIIPTKVWLMYSKDNVEWAHLIPN